MKNQFYREFWLKWMVWAGFLFMGTSVLKAQVPLQIGTLSDFPHSFDSQRFLVEKRQDSLGSFSFLPETIIPEYVRENPRGYSYLCRLELKIEEKLPIGVWIKIGENSGFAGDAKGNAHVRFKLFQF